MVLARLFSGLGLGAILVFITLYMFVRADFLFGEFADLARNVILTYIILGVTIIAVTGSRFPLFNASPLVFGYFFIGFIITFFVVSLVPKTLTAGTLASFERVGISFGFLWAFVKAAWEEVIFRGILAQRITSTGLLATLAVGSNILFGFFHYGILGVGLGGAVFLSILGMVWTLMANRLNLMASIGSHFAWNMAALGVL